MGRNFTQKSSSLSVFALAACTSFSTAFAGEIVGQVRSPNGRFIRGADITADVTDWRTRQRLPRLEFKSNADGKFVIDLEPYRGVQNLAIRIAAMSDYHHETSTILRGSPETIPKSVSLEMEPGFPIVGVVLAPDSAPIRGAIIQSGIMQTTTDGEGRYILRGVPNRSGGSILFSADGYVSQTKSYPAGIDFSLELNVILPFSGELRGMVLAPGPHEGGQIFLSAPGMKRSGTIDPDGRFKISGLTDSVEKATLLVDIPGYPPERAFFPSFTADETPVVFIDPPTRFDLSIVDNTGQPVVGATVTAIEAYDEFRGPLTEKSDEDGLVVFPTFRQGLDYTLRIIPDFSENETRRGELIIDQVTSDGNVRGTLHLIGAKDARPITGSFSDGTLIFDLIKGFRYQFSGSESSSLDGEVLSDGSIIGNARLRRMTGRSGLQGTWDFRETIQRNKQHSTPVSETITTIEGASTHSHRIVLPAGNSMTLTLDSSIIVAGDTEPTALVRAGSMNLYSITRPFTHGKAEFAGIPEGTVTVSVLAGNTRIAGPFEANSATTNLVIYADRAEPFIPTGEEETIE